MTGLKTAQVVYFSIIKWSTFRLTLTYAGGAFVNSFVLTDVEPGWTECLALLNKDATIVINAFKEARQRFPFPVLGFDTDNRSEFITNKLYEYCQEERITFTRSRLISDIQKRMSISLTRQCVRTEWHDRPE